MKSVVTFVVAVLAVSVGQCLCGPLGGCVLRDPEIADRVGLTEEQRQELEDVYEATEKEMIKAHADLRIKRLEIDRLVRSERPDMREIRKLVSEAEKARSSAMLARLERRVKVSQMLSSEQMRKVRRAGRRLEGRHMMRDGGPPGRHMMRGGDGRNGHKMRDGGQPGRQMMRGGAEPGRRMMRDGERPVRRGMHRGEMMRRQPRSTPGKHQGPEARGRGCHL